MWSCLCTCLTILNIRCTTLLVRVYSEFNFVLHPFAKTKQKKNVVKVNQKTEWDILSWCHTHNCMKLYRRRQKKTRNNKNLQFPDHTLSWVQFWISSNFKWQNKRNEHFSDYTFMCDIFVHWPFSIGEGNLLRERERKIVSGILIHRTMQSALVHCLLKF